MEVKKVDHLKKEKIKARKNKEIVMGLGYKFHKPKKKSAPKKKVTKKSTKKKDSK
tara:strand:- start:85 stop:249 length:165 start_codon:yes stop_codon:yes gene_type:complete